VIFAPQPRSGNQSDARQSLHPQQGQTPIEEISNLEGQQTVYQQLFRMISSCKANKNRLLFIDFRVVLL
jgi:hypothetical protein